MKNWLHARWKMVGYEMENWLEDLAHLLINSYWGAPSIIGSNKIDTHLQTIYTEIMLKDID